MLSAMESSVYGTKERRVKRQTGIVYTDGKMLPPCLRGLNSHLFWRMKGAHSCYRLCLLKNLGSRHAFCPSGLLVIRFLVSSGQVHAVAICGVGLQRRNRTSRFRFCAVA